MWSNMYQLLLKAQGAAGEPTKGRCYDEDGHLFRRTRSPIVALPRDGVSHLAASDMQRRLVSSVSPAIRCGLIHGCPTSRILMAAFAGLAGVGAATLFYTQERTKDHQRSISQTMRADALRGDFQGVFEPKEADMWDRWEAVKSFLYSWTKRITGRMGGQAPWHDEVPLPTDKLACHVIGKESSRIPGNPSQVVLVECGSFNPPTYMHLRALELAREALFRRGIDVLGAYLSPVNDAYWKPSLIAGVHRLKMCELASESSDFIMADPWEVKQKQYTRTLHVLEAVERRLKDALGLKQSGEEKELTGTKTDAGSDKGGLLQMAETPRTMLVCGADVLQSMLNPSIWRQDLLERVLRYHGVICISREGAGIDVEKVLHDAPPDSALHRYSDNIIIVKDPIPNEVSSSLVRHELENGQSVQHLIPNAVIDYIYERGLYNTTPSSTRGPRILKFLHPQIDKDED